jgi:drug/metabolite transporter (DMT)-like permease
MPATAHSDSLAFDWLAAGAIALASAIWGATFVASKVALTVVPPFTLICGRFALAWAVLRLVMCWQGLKPLSGRTAWIPAVIGAVGMVISIGAQFVGTALTPASHGAFITSASPALMAVFAVFLLGERMHWLHGLAMLLALSGVALVSGVTGGTFHPVGHGALVVAAITWALYSVLTRWASLRHDQLAVLAGACGWGAIFSAPLLRWDWPVARLLEPAVGGSVLFIALGSTVLAFLLWSWGFARLPARIGGLFMFVQPVIGAVLAAWLLHEPMRWPLAAGGGLILVGVAVAQRADRALVVGGQETAEVAALG